MAESLSNGGIIKPIDQSTVHRICSGQVVLTLAVAVKELVENSLDSGASAIDVRLKNYGSDSVEVNDDGCGISPSNFENLCLKHYTSKIEEFEDLLNVQTFGFRGEALSSLCALSTLGVTTCEKGSNIGWKLEYDHHGKLVKKTQYSRQPGTSVMLLNLFSSLPVRHKEFTKNLKREFAKMTNLLTGYCLISKQTRITCTNSMGGRLTTVLSTRGGTNLKDNFTLVFGLKSWAGMLEIKAVQPSEEILAEFNFNSNLLPENVQDFPFQFEGFISSCAHGQGRSCADRQYFFINGRPCDPLKVSKLVNEIYHTYNRHQFPSIVLNITTQSSQIDINVTPDKRQLMVANEKLMLATVKASLIEIYHKIPSTFTLQNSSSSIQPVALPENPSTTTPSRLRSSLAAFAASGWKPSSSSPGEKRKLSNTPLVAKQKQLDAFLLHPTGPWEKKPKFDICDSQETPEESEPELTIIKDKDAEIVGSPTIEIVGWEPEQKKAQPSEVLQVVEGSNKEITVIETLEKLENACEDVLAPVNSLDNPQHFSRVKIVVPFNISTIQKNLIEREDRTKEKIQKRFMAKINPIDTAAAEAELSREINQSDFEKMQVVGQFNLGFIIAHLNSDLFIIDQHAADEKYNFETLQRTTRLQSQKLVCPKLLNLTPANESILQDNLDIFRSNGFDFFINNEEDSTKRISLTSVPMSGNWLLGPSDIDELLFMLQDTPVNEMENRIEANQAFMARYRPSRIRAMFASRACRKAVMVGDSLTPIQMKNLIHHLGELQQPWNCPHGRPTMRHLINLDGLQ